MYEAQLEGRKAVELRLLGRKRYRWDVECEAHTLTSSTSFMETLQSISYYFRSQEEIEKLPNKVLGSYAHYHSSTDHDHDQDIAVKGVPPEVALIHIGFFQGWALLYVLTILILFICQTSCKPRIKDSKKELQC